MIRIVSIVILCVFTLCLSGQTFETYNFDACSEQSQMNNLPDLVAEGNPECSCGVSDSGVRLRPGDKLTIPTGMLNFFQNDFSISFYFKALDNQDQLLLLNGAECNTDSSFTVLYDADEHRIDVIYRRSGVFFIREQIALPQTQCWHHIVLAKSNQDFFFYLNGEIHSSILGLVIDFPVDDFLEIGSANCPGISGMNGDIDEFRLYNRILSPAEVTALYLRTDYLESNRIIGLEGVVKQVRILNSCADSYSWSPPTGLNDPSIADPLVTIAEDQVYVVRMMHEGCTSIDTLEVLRVDSSALICDRLLLPSAFTPNGDDLNETYGISNAFIVDDLISFRILNRLGELMFETSNLTERWDASFKGTPVNAGVYISEIVYTCQGEEYHKIGRFKVLR